MITINGKEFLRFTYQDAEGVDNFICLPVNFTERDIVRELKHSGMIRQNCQYASFRLYDYREYHNFMKIMYIGRSRKQSAIFLTPVRD